MHHCHMNKVTQTDHSNAVQSYELTPAMHAYLTVVRGLRRRQAVIHHGQMISQQHNTTWEGIMLFVEIAS